MCDCGCYDCPACFPDLQAFVECECCGNHVHRYDFCEQTGRCPDCEKASMIQCEVCGKWFSDNTGEDWAEENIVFCSEKCHIASTTPSPAGNPGNLSKIIPGEVEFAPGTVHGTSCLISDKSGNDLTLEAPGAVGNIVCGSADVQSGVRKNSILCPQSEKLLTVFLTLFFLFAFSPVLPDLGAGEVANSVSNDYAMKEHGNRLIQEVEESQKGAEHARYILFIFGCVFGFTLCWMTYANIPSESKKAKGGKK